MPTIQPLAPAITPSAEAKPIPVRVISTKTVPREPTVTTEKKEIANQQINNGKVVAESTAPAESVSLSPQLSALARKEQAFRQREQAVAERERIAAAIKRLDNTIGSPPRNWQKLNNLNSSKPNLRPVISQHSNRWA